MIQDAKKKQIYLTNIPISSIVNSAIGTNIRTRNIYLNIKEKAISDLNIMLFFVKIMAPILSYFTRYPCLY